MNTVKLVVIDNFFSDPDVIRKWALSEKYYDTKELTEITSKVSKSPNYFPGLRTLPLTKLKSPYSEAIMNSTARIGRHVFGIQGNIDLVSSFHLTRKDDIDMANIHTDNSFDPGIVLAGVIYLTPDAPLDSGTTLYTKQPHKEVDKISNVYNRFVLYDASVFHRANSYFGDDMQTGRLTIVSFIRKV